MARVVLVSNRVGDLTRGAAQAGGVAVLLAEVLEGGPTLWFGWNGRIEKTSRPGAEVAHGVRSNGQQSSVVAVPLTQEEHADYYLGYSNSVLWPVFHNRLDLARFDAGFYRRYLEVNERFATELARHLKPGDVIWVHDFHLIPIAQTLRAAWHQKSYRVLSPHSAAAFGGLSCHPGARRSSRSSRVL